MATNIAEPAADGAAAPNAHLLLEDRVWLMRAMLLMRGLEERAMTLYRQGKVPGSFYDGYGQEAVSAGAAFAMGPQDRNRRLRRNPFDVAPHVAVEDHLAGNEHAQRLERRKLDPPAAGAVGGARRFGAAAVADSSADLLRVLHDAAHAPDLSNFLPQTGVVDKQKKIALR